MNRGNVKEFPPWQLVPLLLTQGLWARWRTPRLPPAEGPTRGQFGSGPVLNLLAIGDSIIAGVGVESTWQAMPARLAERMAKASGRRVKWTAHGENGARTADLLRWLREHDWPPAEVVVISNGINDLTSLKNRQDFLADKRRLYEGLRRHYGHALVVQLGLPPLGGFPALPQPLREGLGRRSRFFDAALGRLIGEHTNMLHLPFDELPPRHMFAADGYHPNAAGVSEWSARVADQLSGRY